MEQICSPATGRSFLVLIFLFCAHLLFSQQVEFTFYEKGEDPDGLIANPTNDICQGPDGFLWFLNESRPMRFDGRRFIEYPDLSDHINRHNRLQALTTYEDSLLAYILEKSVVLFNPRTKEQTVLPFPALAEPGYSFEQQKSEGNGAISLFFAAPDNKSRGQYLWLENRKIRPAPPAFEFLDEQRVDVIQDRYGHYLIIQQNNLWVIDSLNELQESYLFFPELGGNHRSILPSTRLDAQGDLITLYRSQFHRYRVKEKRLEPHPVNRFLKDKSRQLRLFTFDKQGKLWICGNFTELLCYDPAFDTLYSFREQLNELIPENMAFTGFYQDKSGALWVTSQLGLLRIRQRSEFFDTYLTEENPDGFFYSTRGMAERPDGRIYVSYYSGIVMINPDEDRAYPTDISREFPFGLLAHGDELWMNNGWIWNAANETLVPFSGNMNIIQDQGLLVKDDHNRIWWSIFDRIYYQDPGKPDRAWILSNKLPIKSGSADAFHFGNASGHLWIGVLETLFRYDPVTDALYSYSNDDFDIPVRRIMAIHENPDGSVWLGTDKGLLFFDPASGKTRSFRATDGMSDSYVCSLIAEGDSCLWLGTNNGLTRFQSETGQFLKFSKRDGLPDNEFNRASYLRASDGRFYFGGRRGVTAFYPDRLIRDFNATFQPTEIRLSAFEKKDERRDTIYRQLGFGYQPAVKIFSWDRSFSFEFVLTDYQNPDATEYSYQMDGYEQNWSAPSTDNVVRYNNLPFGTYTFRVRARDDNGRWHPDELAVSVRVYPPWWLSWWAIVGYILILIAAVWAYIRWRTGLVEAQKRVLEKTVEERTRELLEQKQRAEQSEKYKEQFLANMSHEIRTPMNAILGMVRILLRNPVLPEQQKFLEAIRKSSGNLLVILNDILDLSKIEAGKMEVQKIPLSPEEVMRAVEDILRFKAGEKGLKFTAEIQTDVPELVYGDPTRLTQVLTNLVGNAIKFTESGFVRLRLTSSEDHLIFTVEDSGIGIAPEKLANIFESFRQVHTENRQLYGGTGLGLSISRQLVELMDGKIAVKSSVGVGTTFTLKLPLEAVAMEVVRQSKVDEKELHQMGKTLTGTHILLVDDNEFNRLLATDDLTYLIPEVTITTAENGEEAVKSWKEHSFDLILMDVQMPVMDGLEATRRIRTLEKMQPETPRTPIIAMTASLLKKEVDAILVSDMDDYIPKPYELQELIANMHRTVHALKQQE